MVNEQKILQIYSDDPQRGFKLLMDCYQEPVYYYVRRQLVSHDDAEDVTQEVFIRIFRGLDGFKRNSSLTTWIYTIATREVLRWLEKRQEMELVSAEALQEELVGKLKSVGICGLRKRAFREVSGCCAEPARKTAAGVQPSLL